MQVIITDPKGTSRSYPVPGNSAVIGRDALECDVAVDPELRSVSRRHCKIISGVVVVDLGAVNGTFVNGQRITEAAEFGDSTIQLGEDVTLRVELDSAEAASPLEELDIDMTIPSVSFGAKPAQPAPPTAELEAEVQRLRDELERASAAPPPAAAPAADAAWTAELEQSVERLRGERDQAREATLAAELAASQSQEQAAELTAEIEQLRQRAAEGAEHTNHAVWAEELELKCGRLRSERDRAREEATQLAEAAQRATALEQEVEKLRAEAAAAPVVPAEPVGNVQLLQENLALKARIAQLERKLESGAGSPVPQPVAQPQEPANASAAAKLVFKLQQENAKLKRDLAAGGAGGAPAAVPSAAVPPAAVPPAAVPSAGAGSGLTELSEFLRTDSETSNPQLPTPTFLLVESHRVLRRFEKLITRVAGELIQLFQAQTMVPGMQGNMRELVGAVIRSPNSQDAHQALVEYYRELRRWLLAALGAYRKASETFASELVDELSEAGLTRAEGLRNRAGSKGGDAELWKRATRYLAELTPEIRVERIQKLARSVAQDLVDNASS